MHPGNKLHYNTTAPLLLNVLKTLMACYELKEFRLVGGTALSLQTGHRKSADIDLFSDVIYGSLDFATIDSFLRSTYSYFDSPDYPPIGMGKSYFIGNTKEDCIKLDLFYTDMYFDEVVLIDNIRLASISEITAMKLDIVSRGGRKKDFWDIHELKDEFTFRQMLDLHKKRYPFSHDPASISGKFIDFSGAENDFDPICLRGKHWEIIKLDLIDFLNDQK